MHKHTHGKRFWLEGGGRDQSFGDEREAMRAFDEAKSKAPGQGFAVRSPAGHVIASHVP